MRKELLYDIVRRVSDLTGVEEPVIVGSQSLYAATEYVPSIVRNSVECDFMLAEAGIEAIQAVNHHLGILSSFSKNNGYFADGLGLATVVLAPGWKERLVPLKDGNGQTVALCLELHDTAVSKLMAGRDKDYVFLN